jgi:hypothetical protein
VEDEEGEHIILSFTNGRHISWTSHLIEISPCFYEFSRLLVRSLVYARIHPQYSRQAPSPLYMAQLLSTCALYSGTHRQTHTQTFFRFYRAGVLEYVSAIS